MINLDSRTSFLILGILYLLLPIITWIALDKHRSRPVALWCGGGLMVGFTAIAVGLYGSIPDWIAPLLAALLFLIGSFARIQSLRLDLNIAWSSRDIVVATVLIFSIILGLHYGLHNYVLRAQFFSVVAACLLAHLAVLAWRIGTQEQSRNAKWIASVYALVASTFLLRVFFLWGVGGNTAIVEEKLSAQLISFTGLLSAVIGHLSYIGLALDRSMRRELKTTADQVRAEENNRLSEQIAQMDRRRGLGELSASLGHELNQPLTAILTNAEVAKLGLQSQRLVPEKHIELLDRIVYNTQRASKIIERIRAFVRQTRPCNETVNLSRVVAEVSELVAHDAASRQVNMEFSADSSPVWVRGDPIQLSQIVLNVLRNAIEALASSNQREIRMTCEVLNHRAILRIKDSGPGLAPETLTQVGTPFFTTKADGLGMGISISRSIAIHHGGTLSISNNAGAGALVELNLPAFSE